MKGDPVPSILITGASSGLGCGAAVELARRGWRVFAGVRNPDASPLAEELDRSAAALRSRVQVIRMDVTTADEVTTAAEVVRAATGGAPDVVWCNAGWGAPAFFEELSDADSRAMMETMFFGTLAVARAFLPAMRERGSGRIAVTSSNAANAPHPMFSVYAAAKWALEGWAEALDLEVRRFGLDVMVLQPGNHATAFAANLRLPEQLVGAYEPLRTISTQRLAALGERARDPERAFQEIADALGRSKGPLRVRIGPDDKAFAVARHLLPFPARRRAVEWVTGFDRVAIERPGLGHRTRHLNHTHEREDRR